MILFDYYLCSIISITEVLLGISFNLKDKGVHVFSKIECSYSFIIEVSGNCTACFALFVESDSDVFFGN